MKADDVKNGVEIVKLLSDIIGSWVDRQRKQRERDDEREERLRKLEAELSQLRAERQGASVPVSTTSDERGKEYSADAGRVALASGPSGRA
jgi:hypothetical protein